MKEMDYSSLQLASPYEITQCYLSLGRGDIPTFTSAKLVFI